MLKIGFSETPSEERWILQGRLTAPWFRELRASWKRNHRRDNRRACVVDLNEITFIDKGGERLLRLLVSEGAQCIATGDYTKHVLEKLTTKGKNSLLSRLAGFFFAAVVTIFAVHIGAQCIASGVYIKYVFEQIATKNESSFLNRFTGFLFAAIVAAFAVLTSGTTAKAQNAAVTGGPPLCCSRDSFNAFSFFNIDTFHFLRTWSETSATYCFASSVGSLPYPEREES